MIGSVLLAVGLVVFAQVHHKPRDYGGLSVYARVCACARARTCECVCARARMIAHVCAAGAIAPTPQ